MNRRELISSLAHSVVGLAAVIIGVKAAPNTVDLKTLHVHLQGDGNTAVKVVACNCHNGKGLFGRRGVVYRTEQWSSD